MEYFAGMGSDLSQGDADAL